MGYSVKLILDLSAIPVEERSMVVYSILRSLNPPDSDINRKWTAIAKRRIAELRSAKSKLCRVKRCSVGSGSVFPHEIFIYSAKRIVYSRFHPGTRNANKNPNNPVNPV